jgi:hypothetical protein
VQTLELRDFVDRLLRLRQQTETRIGRDGGIRQGCAPPATELDGANATLSYGALNYDPRAAFRRVTWLPCSNPASNSISSKAPT